MSRLLLKPMTLYEFNILDLNDRMENLNHYGTFSKVLFSNLLSFHSQIRTRFKSELGI